MIIYFCTRVIYYICQNAQNKHNAMQCLKITKITYLLHTFEYLNFRAKNSQKQT